jgi:hypothetical protein
MSGGEKATPGFGKTVNPIVQRFGQEADTAPGVTILFSLFGP